jgi:hypothetical protein
LAAAVVGKTPFFGLHIRENRCGQVLFEMGKDLNAEMLTYAEYGALAFYAGGIAEDRIPVWNGIPVMSEAELKYFTISHLVGGAVAIVHIVGVTPEAPTLEMAFCSQKPEERIVVGRKELETSYEKLTTATKKEIDSVALGCPHLTIQELKELARLLEGKRVHSGVKFWLGTNRHTLNLAQRMGIVEVIEKSGAVVNDDMCSGLSSFSAMPDLLGVSTIVTNSATCANLIPGLSLGRVKCYYKNMQECVDIGIRGGIE